MHPNHTISRRSALALLIAAAGYAASLPACGTSEPPSHADIAGKPDLVIKDAQKELKQSEVTAYFDRDHTPTKSIVYCATFQIAWDQLPAVLNAPLTLEGDPIMAVMLNKSPWKLSDLDNASYVARAGIGPSTIEAIKSDLDTKFHGAASPAVLPSPSDIGAEDILAYAYLFKNLAFETPFSKHEPGLSFWTPGNQQPASVKAFTLDEHTPDWSKVASQVLVRYYNTPTDFVLELKTKQPDDRLIIARCEPGKTLKQTVAKVLSNTHSDPGSVKPDEDVMIPVLNFDVTRKYHEIIGKRVTTSWPKPLEVSEAVQNIRFRLDEKGAVLKSDAAIGVRVTAQINPPQKREFIFNGPFLVMMLRKDAKTPYFAAWIENPELLVPFK